MTNSKNQTQVQDITNRINEAEAVYLIDYKGITANNFNQLRSEIRKQGGELQVIKNTLFTIALRDSKQKVSLNRNTISDSSAALYAQDPVLPIKAIIKFGKESGIPALKVGFYQGSQLSPARLTQLSELPDKKVLQGQVVGMLASPMSRLVGSLNSSLQKLVITLSEIQKQKSS